MGGGKLDVLERKGININYPVNINEDKDEINWRQKREALILIKK